MLREHVELKVKKIISDHGKDYKTVDAYKYISSTQLINIIEFYITRAMERTTKEKREKDLHEAESYLYFLIENILDDIENARKME